MHYLLIEEKAWTELVAHTERMADKIMRLDGYRSDQCETAAVSDFGRDMEILLSE